jgi:hypothetical protein
MYDSDSKGGACSAGVIEFLYPSPETKIENETRVGLVGGPDSNHRPTDCEDLCRTHVRKIKVAFDFTGAPGPGPV